MLKRALALSAALIAVAGLVTACGSSASAKQGALDFATTAGTPGTVILDVRTPAEYAEGHIPGAVNIDVEGGTFDQQIAGLDTGATYALYCHSGRRSANAAAIMADAGFTHLVELDGGIQAWNGPLTPGMAP